MPGLKNYKDYRINKIVVSLFLYIVVALLFFNKIFNNIYISTTDDGFFSFYCWNTFFRNCIEKGIFPLWNPLVLCGHPYHLESVSNFSLSNFLLLFFNVNIVWNLKLFLSTVGSGWLTFILLKKHFKISIVAAFIGGLVYMFLMPDLFDNPPFFLPLIFILADKWIERKKFLWLFLLSITFSVYFFNANPQFVLYVYIFSYLYIVISSFSVKAKFSVVKVFLAAATGFLPFIIAGGLSSLRLIPMFEMLNLSHRGSMSTFSSLLLPTHLINVIYPRFYMTSIAQHLNFFPDKILNGVAFAIFGADRIRFINGPYIGILPFILALLIIVKKNKSFAEKFFSCTAITILLYVMFNALLYPIIAHIPLLNKMPFIGRSYLLFNFSTAILAGFGMESLLKKETLNLRKILRFLFILGIGILTFKAIIQAVLILFSQNILTFLTKTALPYMATQPFYKASPDFYFGRLQEFVVFLKSWASPANSYFLIPTVILFASLAILFFYIKDKLGKKIFIAACVFIIFLDFYYNFSLPACKADKIVTHYGAADFIKRQQGVFRVMPLLQNYDEKNPSPMDVRTFLRPESSMLYGIMTPEGYRSLYLDRYADIMSLLTGEPAQSFKVRLGEFGAIDENIANLLNIKYVVALKNKNMPGGYKVVYEDNLHKIFLNENALPRAFIVHNAIVMKQKEQILKELNSNIDFSKSIILEDEPQNSKPADGMIYDSKVSIERYEPNKVIISTDNSKDGFLVLLDCYYPGWKAYIDDKPVKIFKANYIFRAVEVTQGKHIVKFSYEPVSLKIGFILSSVFFLSGIVLCIFLRKKT